MGKRRLWKRSVFLHGALRGEHGGGSFTGDFERYVKEGCGGGRLTPWGPHWGNLEGGLLHWGI
jgi:hypothetical protein